MDSQFKKGLLEFCVLTILEKNDSYGYQIIKDLKDYIIISESTLYPILRRMEECKNIDSYMVAYNNRTRKYFHLTQNGKMYLKEFRDEMGEIFTIFHFIEGKESHDE